MKVKERTGRRGESEMDRSNTICEKKSEMRTRRSNKDSSCDHIDMWQLDPLLSPIQW
jgi:hypothetical protein